MSRTVTQAELAGILGLTTRQIRNLEAEGMPHKAAGNRKVYPIPEAVQWYVAREQTRAAPSDYDDARARKMAAEAEMAELDLAIRRGEVLEIKDFESALERPLLRVRAALMNVPGKYAPRVVGLETAAEAQGILDEVVRDAMAELALTGDGDAPDSDR